MNEQYWGEVSDVMTQMWEQQEEETATACAAFRFYRESRPPRSVLKSYREWKKDPNIKRVCVGYPVTPLIFLAFALWATVWSISSQPVPTLLALATLLIVYAGHAVTTGRNVKSDIKTENNSE